MYFAFLLSHLRSRVFCIFTFSYIVGTVKDKNIYLEILRGSNISSTPENEKQFLECRLPVCVCVCVCVCVSARAHQQLRHEVCVNFPQNEPSIVIKFESYMQETDTNNKALVLIMYLKLVGNSHFFHTIYFIYAWDPSSICAIINLQIVAQRVHVLACITSDQQWSTEQQSILF
jgi:hypothetical protein